MLWASWRSIETPTRFRSAGVPSTQWCSLQGTTVLRTHSLIPLRPIGVRWTSQQSQFNGDHGQRQGTGKMNGGAAHKSLRRGPEYPLLSTQLSPSTVCQFGYAPGFARHMPSRVDLLPPFGKVWQSQGLIKGSAMVTMPSRSQKVCVRV